MSLQRRRDLAHRGPRCTEHDGVDLRSQVSQNNPKIGTCRVDKQNF